MVKFYVFHVFVYLRKFWNKTNIGVDGRESTNEMTVKKIITSAGMLKRQSSLVSQ